MRATQDFSTPRQPWPRLGVAPGLSLTTHRRGSPRICVGSQQLTHLGSKLTTQDPHLNQSCVTQSFTRPTHRRGKLTQVTFEAHVWKSSNVTPSLLAHSRATHMRRTASICVQGKLNFQVLQDSRI
ncbi:hypothetical protein PIB30_099721 [Stylosanthes scabra]|uniref:Uncharacterized protein n=1 Tax=Stylosanthes scabra TaxID=79078 RepID=A0ABU6UWE3_9FABA|nr:hypothetical protein [Stylosanthes scabra]